MKFETNQNLNSQIITWKIKEIIDEMKNYLNKLDTDIVLEERDVKNIQDDIADVNSI